MGNNIFSKSGLPVGFHDGQRIYDLEGRAVGRLRGSQAYCMAGHHVGELRDGVLLAKNNDHASLHATVGSKSPRGAARTKRIANPLSKQI